MDEERIRDYFLPHLNSISTSLSATGETFNKKGRTDILVQDRMGHNVFIAECKLWKGSLHISNALNQLFERYVSWRDEKTALLVFNKEVSGFSGVVEKAVESVNNHPYCLEMLRKRKDTSFSFLFRHAEDPGKRVKLELMLFNFYAT